MSVLNLNNLTALKDLDLGHSDWLELSQSRIDEFARVTLDDQWIHTDVARSERESPYKSTIAHGFLSLSLLSYFHSKQLQFESGVTVINYGLNKLRFLAPVKAGGFVRNHLLVVSAEKKAKGVLLTTRNTLGIKHEDTPALIAESLLLVLT